jgi:hypothetical protein
VISRGVDTNARLWLDGVLVAAGPLNDAKAPWLSAPVALTRGRPVSLRFEYSQPDQTGQHPSFALQWSLLGGSAGGDAGGDANGSAGGSGWADALAAVAGADAVVVAVGGSSGQYRTSGEGVDRAGLGLPGNQLAFLQVEREASMPIGVGCVCV